MLTRRQLIIIGIGLAVILTIILIFTFGLQKKTNFFTGEITVWGVFDDRRIFGELINDYQKIRPNIQVHYRQMNPLTYETDLINSLAAGKGPDVFAFHNTWLPKHYAKIFPLSQQRLPLINFRNLFPTVIEQDFAPDGVIYALPLYIDTLALYYNKDMFDTKGIVFPPKTWEEFQNSILKLRELDKDRKIIKAAAAIGGSNKSVNRATDLLNLLMLQSGAAMVNQDFTEAKFGDEGLSALNFYTSFANPASLYYTWNDNLPYSIDSFTEQSAAMMFNYSHQINLIRNKNPFLNFGIAPMPQPSKAQTIINWANYWGLTVAANSRQPAIAWDFILWLTTRESAARKYSILTGRPPALRSLIAAYATHPDLNVFSRQALTARSWPQIDNQKIEDIFSETIKLVIGGRMSTQKALRQAEDKITQLIQRRAR